MNSQHYSNEFYAKHIDGMAASANVILPLIYKQFTPRSILDVGCGQGAWLAVAEALGTESLTGIDGNWVNQNRLATDKMNFKAVDLGSGMPPISEKYDLCLCLEVAEHLPSERASDLVDFLCKSSDLVLFSAAVRHQGGENHLNEQWQSYWVDLFSERQFHCIDLVRPLVWNSDEVEWWYKQNIFLFAKDGAIASRQFQGFSRAPIIYNLIHPAHFEEKLKIHDAILQSPSFNLLMKISWRLIRNLGRKIFLRQRLSINNQKINPPH